MFEYRAVLVRLRQGDSDRDIARARCDAMVTPNPALQRRVNSRLWRL
jgi:hypothetical protein